MKIKISIAIFCLFILLDSGLQIQAQTTKNTSLSAYAKQTRTLLKKLNWLPTGTAIKETQAQVFQSVQVKAGRQISRPTPPANALIQWQYYRYYPQGDDTDLSAPIESKLLYALVGEDLLLAQELLSKNDLRQQRRGLQLMFTVVLNTDMRLKDNALTAGIYDAFMLPFLVAAYENPADGMSRTAVLQNATGIYKKQNDKEKYETSLRVLVSLANAAKVPQVRDWARYKLGLLYAEQNRLDQAIAIMSLVSASGLVPGKNTLLKEWQERKAASSTSTRSSN